MNTVTIKDFQKNLYASIKELPLIITKNGQPFLKVEAFSKEVNSPTIRPIVIRKESLPEPLHTVGITYPIPTDLAQFSDKKQEGYHYSEMLGKYVKD